MESDYKNTVFHPEISIPHPKVLQWLPCVQQKPILEPFTLFADFYDQWNEYFIVGITGVTTDKDI